MLKRLGRSSFSTACVGVGGGRAGFGFRCFAGEVGEWGPRG